jgi:GH25 family lysozyme M1 (1,4-beta-N-acetylmuramidase)
MNKLGVEYQVHMADYGWGDWVRDGAIAGTIDQARRIEAVRFRLTNKGDLDIVLLGNPHIATKGWTGFVGEDEVCGTTGEALALEAIQFALRGADADRFSVQCRMENVENIGELDWVTDEGLAGTVGAGLRAEAIEILITDKGVDLGNKSLDGYRYFEPVAVPVASVGGLQLLSGERGVDVSYWQGRNIDWVSVRNDGNDFSISRALESLDRDSTFAGNVIRSREAGLKAGAYQYMRATNVAEAVEEAQAMINVLIDIGGTFPAGVWADMEQSGTEGSADEVIDVWCTMLTNAGYPAGFYCNYNWIKNYVSDSIKNKWAFWLAQYTNTHSTSAYLWQFSSSGAVAGISGNVDINVVC